ncbi:BA75_00125T0 [Komagataella pastoris]|uniref:BA75_00125T0 n=1 Tax=Komagataella pastoris TaxID=4922 RepID=A0A1B2J8G5_PICPA|nr:BA75_00125T0 [Komagataella pastoris]
MDRRRELNILMLGNVGVGKSSITLQFVQNQMPEHHDDDIEDTYSRVWEIEGKEYQINILDTADSSQSTMETDLQSDHRRQQILATQGIILAFRINSKDSFDNLSNILRNLSRIRGESLPPILLLGNMMDLEDEREVSRTEAEYLQYQYKLDDYIEASASMRLNVEDVFTRMIELILNIPDSKPHSASESQAGTRQNSSMQVESKHDRNIDDEDFKLMREESYDKRGRSLSQVSLSDHRRSPSLHQSSAISGSEAKPVAEESTKNQKEITESNQVTPSKENKDSREIPSDNRTLTSAIKEKSATSCCILM